MIRILLADDESSSLEKMGQLLALHGDFQIVATAVDGEDALEKLKKNAVDAVFLDIDMPGLDGLTLAGKLIDWPAKPLIIFMTAHNEYAVQAFEKHALDYLLKPVEPARLKACLNRIRESLSSGKPPAQDLAGLQEELIEKGSLKKIVGFRRNSKDRAVLDPSDILFFCVEYSQLYAHTAEEVFLIRATLREILENPSLPQFRQTHKSYAVNLGKIQKLCPLFHGDFEILLKGTDKNKVPLSRKFAKHLLKLFAPK
ncbi:MAG: LytR/AlgR family response regulator transcription factor [Candidatus Omnitrophota bacterium]